MQACADGNLLWVHGHLLSFLQASWKQWFVQWFTRCEEQGEKWVNNGSKKKLISWLLSLQRKEQAWKGSQSNTRKSFLAVRVNQWQRQGVLFRNSLEDGLLCYWFGWKVQKQHRSVWQWGRENSGWTMKNKSVIGPLSKMSTSWAKIKAGALSQSIAPMLGEDQS